MIQDHLMAAANLIMSYALLPQVIWGFRHRDGGGPVLTAGLTTLGLLIMTTCMFSLEAYWTAGMCSITTMLWACILWQRLYYKKVG